MIGATPISQRLDFKVDVPSSRCTTRVGPTKVYVRPRAEGSRGRPEMIRVLTRPFCGAGNLMSRVTSSSSSIYSASEVLGDAAAIWRRSGSAANRLAGRLADGADRNQHSRPTQPCLAVRQILLGAAAHPVDHRAKGLSLRAFKTVGCRYVAVIARLKDGCNRARRRRCLPLPTVFATACELDVSAISRCPPGHRVHAQLPSSRALLSSKVPRLHGHRGADKRLLAQSLRDTFDHLVAHRCPKRCRSSLRQGVAGSADASIGGATETDLRSRV